VGSVAQKNVPTPEREGLHGKGRVKQGRERLTVHVWAILREYVRELAGAVRRRSCKLLVLSVGGCAVVALVACV
jgi:hypothetical protein